LRRGCSAPPGSFFEMVLLCNKALSLHCEIENTISKQNACFNRTAETPQMVFREIENTKKVKCLDQWRPAEPMLLHCEIETQIQIQARLPFGQIQLAKQAACAPYLSPGHCSEQTKNMQERSAQNRWHAPGRPARENNRYPLAVGRTSLGFVPPRRNLPATAPASRGETSRPGRRNRAPRRSVTVSRFNAQRGETSQWPSPVQPFGAATLRR
jgi:hypothetical protein